MATASTTLPSLAAADASEAAAAAEAASFPAVSGRQTGSLSRRMMLVAAVWISILLLVGGLALERTLTGQITRSFDEQLAYVLNAMVASTEIDQHGEVFFNRPLGDQRFLEPNSGLYWQISGPGHEDYSSRSLWDRSLKTRSGRFDAAPVVYDSAQFASEPLRIMERSIILPGSKTNWRFAVAASRGELDAQIRQIRAILSYSFVILGLGLFVMAGLQTWYGLGPLRRLRRAIKRMRVAGASQVTDPVPQEVRPLVEELNSLLAHSEQQAAEARTHAGNLAHALKTPLTVVMNAATARADDLPDTVIREAAVMRRQVDHHLARARAVGRRAAGRSRAQVGESAEAVLRAVTRLHPQVRFDLDGDRTALVAIERQDLDEILGNLVENAAKYGGGSVFVTIDAVPDSDLCEIWVEDDGAGIPAEMRHAIFDRGARLDTGKPGTGLGLAIVRDVAELYGGTVELGESEDLGGLLVRLRLPRAGA